MSHVQDWLVLKLPLQKFSLACLLLLTESVGSGLLYKGN